MSDGTDQGLKKQVECFLAALTEGESRLTKSAQKRDFSALAEAAHHVLSHAKLVGSSALEEAAINLESAARSRDDAAFGVFLERLHAESSVVREAMRRPRPAAQPA